CTVTKWSDLDFDNCTILVQRSMVHGKAADVKTEYSRDHVPLDAALVEILLTHRLHYHRTKEDWIFANPETDRPYHQDTIQQNHIRKAGKDQVSRTASAGTRSGTTTGHGSMTRARRHRFRRS